MADEPILEAGYALFFEAVVNEPLLDLELLLAIYSGSQDSSDRSTGATSSIH
jgi:hypothetical protein